METLLLCIAILATAIALWQSVENMRYVRRVRMEQYTEPKQAERRLPSFLHLLIKMLPKHILHRLGL